MVWFLGTGALVLLICYSAIYLSCESTRLYEEALRQSRTLKRRATVERGLGEVRRAGRWASPLLPVNHRMNLRWRHESRQHVEH
jgi:hypothetical protein